MIATYLLDSSMLPDPLNPGGSGRLDSLDAFHWLPKERAEKIRRYRQPQARKQCLGAGLLLDYGIRMACVQGIPGAFTEGVPGVFGSNALPVQYNPFGKPYIEGVAFNLSHAGDYVIVSVWQGQEEVQGIVVGCDIERPRGCQAGIARRFFTSTEYACLEAMDQEGQAALFCRYWTRKESVMKAVGVGMALPMDAFDISSGQVTADEKKIMEWQEAPGDGQAGEVRRAAGLLLNGRLHLKEYSGQGYCITVCSTAASFAPAVSYLSEDVCCYYLR